MDEFALKKGQVYGTVLIDAMTHRVVDLLDSREESEVAEWLKEYKNIQIISRDGGLMYKNASTEAHPEAIQVSDRFHVLKNLTEYMKKYIQRILKKEIYVNVKNQEGEKECKTTKEFVKGIRKIMKKRYKEVDVAKQLGISERKVKKYKNLKEEELKKYDNISKCEIRKQEALIKKEELRKEIRKEYWESGNKSQVARRLGISTSTVRKYLYEEEPLTKLRRDKFEKLEKYKEEINKMSYEGYSFKRIYEKAVEHGYDGSRNLLRKYIKELREKSIKEEGLKEKVERKSIIKLIYKEVEEVKEISKELLERIIEEIPEVGRVIDIVKDFKRIMFSKKEEKLDEWIEIAKEVKIGELNSFVNGIERDKEAVKNGIKYEINNGLAEGTVNKIKLVKRIMYGRGSFDLLKQKILLLQ